MAALLPRYNIALLPVDSGVNEILTAYAQTHFAVLAEGYLLGDRALPHVTLCQFYAPDDAIAHHVFDGWKEKAFPTAISVQSLYLKSGTDAHAGQYLVGLTVTATPELIDAQYACHTHIAAQGLQTLTPSERFVPHITLASLRREPHTLAAFDIPSLPHSFAVTLGLGQANEKGVFLHQLAVFKPQ